MVVLFFSFVAPAAEANFAIAPKLRNKYREQT
jgi:hypothetical protein